MKQKPFSHVTKIVITAGLILSLGFAIWGGLDSQGEKYTDAGLKRAMIAFGVARGLNGVISVAQGTEVSLQPAGVGVNLAPGQILDPINDLVERFSVVMLFSASSLGVQKLLLSISSWPWLTVVLVLFTLVFLANLWRAQKFLPTWANQALIVFLLLRFSVPAFALANEGFYQLFLAEDYQASLQSLKATSNKIQDMNTAVTSEEKETSLFGKAKGWLQSTQDSLSLKQKLAQYKEIAANASDHVVSMIVVFVVQTVLLPLGFLWLLLGWLKRRR